MELINGPRPVLARPRFIRNLIRRWHIKRQLGPGTFCKFTDGVSMECDFCEGDGILVERGRVYCPKHAGYHSAEHLRIAMKFINARASAYKPS